MASLISPIVADNFELAFISPLFEHLKSLKEVSSIIDFCRIAIMGHSRGGRLATLHFVDRPDVSTAFVIDPVDGVFEIVRQSTAALLKTGGFLVWAIWKFNSITQPVSVRIGGLVEKLVVQVLVQAFNQPPRESSAVALLVAPRSSVALPATLPCSSP